MNEERDESVASMARTWTVETTDLTSRIAAAIGVDFKPADPMIELLEEIRALRREMEGVRQSNAVLHSELTRLRQDLTTRKAIRIAPYAPIDDLVRLS